MPATIGEFEILVLMAILRLGDDGYAPAIRTEIERRTGRSVARGSVYVTLSRLEGKRLLVSRAADDHGDTGGRPRRYYRVSSKGVKAVRRTLAGLEQMSDGLAPVLSRA